MLWLLVFCDLVILYSLNIAYPDLYILGGRFIATKIGQ